MADEDTCFENKLVTCPYDEAHKLKISKLQQHITKCKKNHLDAKKDVCPFNASHVIEKGELHFHLQNCPNRGSLGTYLSNDVDKNNPYKGRTAVPKSSEPHVDDEENWDIDTEPVSVNLRQQPPAAIREPPEMAKPAERKRFYRDLHLEDKSQLQSDNPPREAPREVLRQPKQKSQAEQVQVQQMNANAAIQNLGLGRGRSSRIAANFGAGADAAPTNVTYSNIVRDMGHMSVSRGQPIPQAGVPMFENDDDFPALGCGRGALHAPKQSVRTPGAKPQKQDCVE